MTDTAIEWWGKAGDQALRRSAFQEAIAHLGKAIEMADKSGEAAPLAAAAAAGLRLKLQTSLANALLQARGQHSPETQEAFSHRCRSSLAARKDHEMRSGGALTREERAPCVGEQGCKFASLKSSGENAVPHKNPGVRRSD